MVIFQFAVFFYQRLNPIKFHETTIFQWVFLWFSYVANYRRVFTMMILDHDDLNHPRGSAVVDPTKTSLQVPDWPISSLVTAKLCDGNYNFKAALDLWGVFEPT